MLLTLYHEGKLPSDEFAQGMALIEKSQNDLTALESKIRKLLDDLTDEKISVAIYLNSVRLLRKPAGTEKKTPVPKPASNVETTVPKTEISAPEIESPKVPQTSIVLRKTPGALSEEEVKIMLAKKNFYDRNWNKDSKGINHNYVEQTLNGDKIVLDKITSLMWQKSGSPNYLVYSDAENYIRELNNKSFAGFTDWRLPTLEEAMSLMEALMHRDLYIDTKFDRVQSRIWTSDKASYGSAWVVDFDNGLCILGRVDGYFYVRAVRSG